MSKRDEAYAATDDAIRRMITDGIEVALPTATTPLQAVLALQIAQTHLLEMLKAEMEEGREGNADRAYQLVQKAIDLIPLDTISAHPIN